MLDQTVNSRPRQTERYSIVEGNKRRVDETILWKFEVSHINRNRRSQKQNDQNLYMSDEHLLRAY